MLLISVGLTSCGLGEPRPAIKEGEFDFSVVCEINGEIKTVSGVYVCKFRGIEFALDGGYYRDWEGYVKDDEEEKLAEIGTTEDGDLIRLSFGFYPDYFMGDAEGSWRDVPAPSLLVVHEDEDGLWFDTEADVIEATYGAKIIRYEYEAPIENTFGLFK
jgi:hypothetical protein